MDSQSQQLHNKVNHTIVSALCREGLLAEDPPAVRAVKRLMFSPAPVQPILPGTLLC